MPLRARQATDLRDFLLSNRFVVVLVWIAVTVSATPELSDQSRPPRAGTSGSEPAPPLPPPEPEPIPVSGRERIAWEFAARSDGEIATLGFTAFVDGEAFPLDDFSCRPVQSALELTCSAPLPPMSPGTHTIRVSAVVDENVNGMQSAAIRVRLEPTSDSDPAASPNRRELSLTTADGVALRAQVVAEGFVDATDLTILPDGVVLVAERAGVIRLVRDGQLVAAAATRLSDVASGDGRGLLALTVDANFERTRSVFAVYTASSGGRLVRFTLQGNTLDRRAILLDGLPLASRLPAASLRMGPDLRLYLGLDDGGEASRAADRGSYSGKVLRLNPDGTTPSDQAGSTPIFVSEMQRPAGFAWPHGLSTTTWILSAERGGSERLYRVSSDETPRRARVVASLTLPRATGASDVVIYDSPALPTLRGDLLVAAEGARAILRLRADGSGDPASEWLLRDVVGPVVSLGVAPDGSIYALAGERLLRISG
jgi:glucose/arabinose dehydrogenase